MKKISLLIMLTIFGYFTNYGQVVPHFDWAAILKPDVNSYYAYSSGAIATTPQGDIITSGRFPVNTDFDPGPASYFLESSSTNKGFIQKLDSKRNLLWAKAFEGAGATTIIFEIAVVENGDIFIAGSFSGSVDFNLDTAASATAISTSSGFDFFVLKLDKSSNYINHVVITGSLNQFPRSMDIDRYGDLVLVGSFNKTVDFDPGPGVALASATDTSGYDQDVFILKLNSNLDYAWHRTLGSAASNDVKSVAVNGLNDIVVYGTCSGGDLDMDPYPSATEYIYSGSSNPYSFLLCLDDEGYYKWHLGNFGNFTPTEMATDANNNIYCVGSFTATVDFGTPSSPFSMSPVPTAFYTNPDAYIQKIDQNGNFVWAKSIGGIGSDGINSIDISTRNGIHLFGISYSPIVDLDPNAGVVNVTNSGGSDIFIINLDMDGNYEWHKIIDATGYIGAFDVVLDPVGNIFGSGSLTTSPTYFNPGVSSDSAVGNDNGIFVVKESYCDNYVLPDSVAIDSLYTLPKNSNATPLVFRNECEKIAQVQPSGTNKIRGKVTAKMWLESTQPADFVKRHYEITPSYNPSISSGYVTLYFSQSDFDDFNAVNAIKLPMDSTDVVGISNIVIEKRGGVSSDGLGLPDSYTGTPTIIDPEDSDIIWNSEMGYWEVSFDVVGFSGFWLKSSSTVLSSTWLEASATLDPSYKANIEWKVNEDDIDYYQIEKSIDGKNFGAIGQISSKGTGVHTYLYKENQTLEGTAYYRILQVDKDNKMHYSSVFKLNHLTQLLWTVAPNPLKNIAQIYNVKIGTRILLTDINGKYLNEYRVNAVPYVIDLSKYSSGAYFLQSEEGQMLKLIKD